MIVEPNSLAETALAFCRGVRKWEYPVNRKFGEQNKDPFGNPSQAWSPYIFDYQAKHPAFHYTDLNVVLAASQSWHRKHKLFLSVYSYPEIEGYCVAIFNANFTVEREHSDLCQALMDACLEANRKLKGIAA